MDRLIQKQGYSKQIVHFYNTNVDVRCIKIEHVVLVQNVTMMHRNIGGGLVELRAEIF